MPKSSSYHLKSVSLERSFICTEEMIPQHWHFDGRFEQRFLVWLEQHNLQPTTHLWRVGANSGSQNRVELLQKWKTIDFIGIPQSWRARRTVLRDVGFAARCGSLAGESNCCSSLGSEKVVHRSWSGCLRHLMTRLDSADR